MRSRQIDRKTTKQVRVDTKLHQLLKVKAAREGMTIKMLLEWFLGDLLAVDKESNNVQKFSIVKKPRTSLVKKKS